MNKSARGRSTADAPSAPIAAQSDSKTSEIPSVAETFRAVLSVEGVLIPAVILGALAYFLGWRFLRDYYVQLGLDPALLSFSVTDVVAAGWRTYLFTAILVLGGAFAMAALQWPLQRALRSGRVRALTLLFLLCLGFAGVLALFETFNILFVWRALSTSVFYIAAFACLAFLWISFIVGERIRTYLAVSEPPQDRLLTVFRVAFPSPLIWLAIICLGLYLTLSFLSSSIGNRWAVRDQSPESHLPIMTVISAEPLSVSGGALTTEGKWQYERLRLIIKTDNTYYVLRPEEVRDGIVKTYGIPGDRVAEIQLYPWFDTIVHP